MASEEPSFSELSESDFFDRNFRVLHIDITDQSSSSILDALNSLDHLEAAVQEKTNANLSIIQYFDLITANFEGGALALLLTCSDKGLFPKYRIGDLKRFYETDTSPIVGTADDIGLSQTCTEVLLPTHDQLTSFIRTQDASYKQVHIEQLISYFNNQEKINYNNKILEKQKNNDESLEAEVIISSEALIMNKCEIWSVGNNSKMKSTAYQIADRKRISLEKILITNESCDQFAEILGTCFKIETTLSKTIPWFYYYTKRHTEEELDLSKSGFPDLGARDLFSLKSLVKNNTQVKKIKFLDGGIIKTIPVSLLDILESSEPELSMNRLLGFLEGSVTNL